MQTNFITTSDKTELFVRDWFLPDEVEKRGSVLIVHGLGEHSGRYEEVAQVLNSIGLEVRSYDHRGHGKSEGKLGAIPYRDAFLDDAKIVFDDLAKDQAESPFLLGHSLGGGVAANLVARKFVEPRGLIMSSPALMAKLSAFQNFQVKFGSLLTPDLAVSNNLKIDFLSHDRQIVDDYKTDSLVHDRITPRLAKFVLDAGQESLAAAKNWSVPTLLLVAGSDHLTNPDGAKQFHANLPQELATMYFYENLYHEIFNETRNERDKVFNDLKNWLLKSLKPQI
ncbi:MAG TPA: lysophospholipase [Pyrinomonadaceae bacterium]|nr:lysophospholipase [Pyrinomonadaceae bacterium]